MKTKSNDIPFIDFELQCNGINVLHQIIEKRRRLVDIDEFSYPDSYSDYSDFWGDSY